MGENRAGLARGAPARGWERLTGTLAAVIAVGAVLRFATVGVQHFWLDEAVTTGLLRLDVDDMVETMWTTESTPPLYYLLARGWAAIFGTGEVGLRSLSAILGTFTIPVAYGVGATLATRRAGLMAATLTALSPALVWYSQEARAYSLAILLAALSLLFAARAVTRGSGRDIGCWAVAASLAVLTHYFAGFLVAAEAAWLLLAHPNRRAAIFGTGAVAVCAAAALPLALHQSRQGNLDFIGDVSVGIRLLDTAQLFLAGPTGERMDLLFLVAAAAGAFVVAAAALGLTRAEAADRRAAVVLLALTAGALAMPVLLAVFGADYVLPRNLLPLLVPLSVAVAIGLAAGARLGVSALAAGAAGSLCVLVAVPLEPDLQREAITAELTGSQIDADRERVDAKVGYALGSAGKTVTARADCDEGYTVSVGNAAVRHDEEWTDVTARETALSGGAAIGQQATERVDADGTVVQVVAVCTRPRD